MRSGLTKIIKYKNLRILHLARGNKKIISDLIKLSAILALFSRSHLHFRNVFQIFHALIISYLLMKSHLLTFSCPHIHSSPLVVAAVLSILFVINLFLFSWVKTCHFFFPACLLMMLLRRYFIFIRCAACFWMLFIVFYHFGGLVLWLRNIFQKF